MSNSDYSFMKSGFNMVEESDPENMEQNVIVLVATFMTEGLKHASYYVKHHKTRDSITPEDIKRGMMLEVFLFNNRPDLLEKTNEIKSLIYDEYDDDDDAEEDIETDNDVEFSESDHDCAITKCMNTIYTRWDNWIPKTPFETIIKNNIDKMKL